MRYVKIENCSYEKFNKIRNAEVLNQPYAIVMAQYSRDLQIAVFAYNDRAYVPDALKEYIQEPPNDAHLAAVNKELEDLDDLNVPELDQEIA